VQLIDAMKDTMRRISKTETSFQNKLQRAIGAKRRRATSCQADCTLDMHKGEAAG